MIHCKYYWQSLVTNLNLIIPVYQFLTIALHCIVTMQLELQAPGVQVRLWDFSFSWTWQLTEREGHLDPKLDKFIIFRIRFCLWMVIYLLKIHWKFYKTLKISLAYHLFLHQNILIFLGEKDSHASNLILNLQAGAWEPRKEEIILKSTKKIWGS